MQVTEVARPFQEILARAEQCVFSVTELRRRLVELDRFKLAMLDFMQPYDVLLCPITPTTAIPHDHQSDVDARRIVVNGISRPYGDQIPWASLPGVCGLPAVVLPAGRARLTLRGPGPIIRLLRRAPSCASEWAAP